MIDSKHVQHFTEIRWLIASSPSYNEFIETQLVHALLKLRKKKNEIEFDVQKNMDFTVEHQIFIICLTSARDVVTIALANGEDS
jgi:hypothetical protein